MLHLNCRYRNKLAIVAEHYRIWLLIAEYLNTYRMQSEFSHMLPPQQLIRMIRNQDIQLEFSMAPARSISSWTVSFTLAKKLAGDVVLTKTVGDGIALTDSGRGVITVTLAAANTSSLTVSSGLASGEGYVWELCRTNSGARVVLARGEFTLEREVTA